MPRSKSSSRSSTREVPEPPSSAPPDGFQHAWIPWAQELFTNYQLRRAVIETVLPRLAQWAKPCAVAEVSTDGAHSAILALVRSTIWQLHNAVLLTRQPAMPLPG